MKVGFTGTQDGMTSAQFETFVSVILALKPTEFHHGDCVGADVEAAVFVRKYLKKTKIVSHPPTKEEKRSFTKCDEIRKPMDYLDRNKVIVDETGILVAVSKQHKEVKRSGTWSTVRYARIRGKQIMIILPDGSIEWENMKGLKV